MNYVQLGADGLDHIATLQCSAEEAQRVTSELRSVSEEQWRKFMNQAHPDRSQA